MIMPDELAQSVQYSGEVLRVGTDRSRRFRFRASATCGFSAESGLFSSPAGSGGQGCRGQSPKRPPVPMQPRKRVAE